MKEGTRLANLVQPPLKTTMMGVLKGAADYHGLGLSEPMVFGLSGHAFLINIHTRICPSGPYCWKRQDSEPLIMNMGLKMTDLGFYCTGEGSAGRKALECKLREAVRKGIPCALVNHEYQLIHGYDGTGFFTFQPWAPEMDFPPSHLSFGTWQEFGLDFHASFYTIERIEPADRRHSIVVSLDHAVHMFRNPALHSSKDYAAGSLAYDNWIAAVPEAGSSHGNWWNATVWSECRRMAALFFHEVGTANARLAGLCSQLEVAYLKIAENLDEASDKTMDPGRKTRLLEDTRQLELAAIERAAELAEKLRT